MNGSTEHAIAEAAAGLPQPHPPTAQDAAPAKHAKKPLSAEDELVRLLLSGTLGLDELATEAGLSVRQLAEWAGDERQAALLASLRRLADERAELLVSRARSGAAAALLKLAVSCDQAETARKACVDLLQLHAGEASSPSTPAPPESAESRSDEGRAFLERLSAAAERLRVRDQAGDASVDAAVDPGANNDAAS